MSKARTERADLLFKVSEYGDGTCFISTEPRKGNLPIIGDAFLGFELQDPSFENAHKVAKFYQRDRPYDCDGWSSRYQTHAR